jgi:predicted transcriptional regulator of viral defense system
MSGDWRSTGPMRQRNAKARVARIADRQWGRVSWAQLLAVGLDEKTVWRWAQAGYLDWILPRVCAVGHQAPSTEADLAAALLYAGPGAMLSHATAVWWWGLIDEQPKTISVSTPRRCKSLEGVKGPRSAERRAGVAQRVAGHVGGADVARLRHGLHPSSASPRDSRG